jgi:peptide/nickel transport system substrate-binding protein
LKNLPIKVILLDAIQNFAGGCMKQKTLTMLLTIMLLSPLVTAQRGSAGELNILYWQAVSILNPYLSGGTKDLDGASLVLEPLASYDPEGNLVPKLAAEIPTVENGGISEDLLSITWKLKEGLLWSDGTPVTAADIVFSGQYCMDPDAGCNASVRFEGITNIEAIDDLTVKITFAEPKPVPYQAFVSSLSPIIQKAQFATCLGPAVQTCTEQNFGPIGTGPFKVVDFRANDVVVYEANENYRDADKPAFSRVVFKGGGDAASAARAILETGEADYAWNLQVEPEVLEGMAMAGLGTVVSSYGPNVERILVNFTNDDPSLGDNRSLYMDGNNPHPFLSDPKVRQALSLAIDRSIIAEVGYGKAGQPTCNLVPAPEYNVSTANDVCLVQDIEKANQLLDEAGWARGSDGIRSKDGVRMSILYQTSTNSVRQGTQALIKQWWEQLGIEVELRNIDAAVFFGGDPASPDTYGKFYADVEMFTNGSSGTDAEGYLSGWTCDQIADVSNDWLGNNIPRWCNPEFDALVAQLATTADTEARADITKQLNDLLVQNYVEIPLVHRGAVSAHANTLKGVQINAWDSEMWNIADWSR